MKKKYNFYFSLSLLILFLSGTTLVSEAQFQKGEILVGGSIGTYDYSLDNSNSTIGFDQKATGYSYSLNFSPKIGLFLTKNLIIGGKLSLNVSSSSSSQRGGLQITGYTQGDTVRFDRNITSNNLEYIIGPFLRYYLNSSNSKNNIFIGVNGGIGSGPGNNKTEKLVANKNYNSVEDKIKDGLNWSAGTSFGITHLFTKLSGLDLEIGYSYFTRIRNFTTTYAAFTAPLTSTNQIQSITYKNRQVIMNSNFTASLGFNFFL
jgi:hypothetical protein